MTSPIELIVATFFVADTHGLIAVAVPDPISCVVDPAQTLRAPVIVGVEITVTVAEVVYPALFL